MKQHDTGGLTYGKLLRLLAKLDFWHNRLLASFDFWYKNGYNTKEDHSTILQGPIA